MGNTLALPGPPARKRRHHAVLMFDEIATEKRFRWDSKTNLIVGGCREHAKNAAVDLNSEKDIEELFRGVADGRIHQAGEATIGALGLLSDNHHLYAARGVLVSGDCKQETGEQHAKLLQTTLDGVNAESENTNIRVVSLASDGESRRGVALTKLTFKKELRPDSDIFNELSPLPFMDLHVGDDDITADKDYKHIFKRLRNLLLRERGFTVGGTRITPSILRSHLQAEKTSEEHIRSILNPDDKQDVKLAYDLLKAVWSLPKATGNKNPSFLKAREALWTFGRFLYHLVIPYISVDLSLDKQLEHLSAATHSAMHLYMTDGKECLSTNLYTDIVIMVKNVYFCVAKSKIDDPDGSFWIILLGTDRLEELFGNLRTMIGNDANLDLLQLSWHLSSTTEVANILARYPHWDRPPRRLQLPAIRADGQPIAAASDHLKPRCWDADLSVKRVTLQTAWALGRRMTEEEVPSTSELFDKIDTLATNPGGTRTYTVLSPHGKPLVDPQCTIEDDDEDLDALATPHSAFPPNELAEQNEEARVEVEDAIAEEDETESQVGAGQTIIERTILVNGKRVLKSRALALWGKYKTHPASTDRLKRVQQVERYTARAPLDPDAGASTHLGDPDATSASVVVHDPIATLLWCEDRPWLCVGEVIGVRLDGKPVEEVPHDMLSEDAVSLVFQLQGLRPATVDEDPTQSSDWRTCHVQDHTFTVPGRLVEPLNPAIASIPAVPSKVFYLFDSALLVSVAAGLLGRLEIADLKMALKIGPSSYFPYREASGKACFLCEDERDLKGLGGTNTFECEFCEHSPVLDISQSLRVIEHNAAHLLHDPKTKTSDQLCGLCLRPVPLCQFFLKKGKGAEASLTIDKKRSNCKYAIKFYYHKAATSTSSAPCSNIPLQCPRCPPTAPAVWKYNLKAHFQEKHPSHAPNSQYSDLWTLTNFEKQEIKRVWKERHTASIRRSKKTDSAPLVVSESHKSNNYALPLQSGNSLRATPECETSSNELSGDDVEAPRLPIQRVTSSGEAALSVPALPVPLTHLSVQQAEQLKSNTENQPALETPVNMNSTSSSDMAGMEPHPEPAWSSDVSKDLWEEVPRPSGCTEATPALPLIPGMRKSSRSVKKRILEDNDEGEAIGNCVCGVRAAAGPGRDGTRGDLLKCSASKCETVWYHLSCFSLERAPSKWVCVACTPAKSGRAPKRAKK